MPVEAGEVEADAAVDRDDVTFEARAGAERRHRDPVVVRDREHQRHVRRSRRVDDEVGPVGWMEA